MIFETNLAEPRIEDNPTPAFLGTFRMARKGQEMKGARRTSGRGGVPLPLRTFVTLDNVPTNVFFDSLYGSNISIS